MENEEIMMNEETTTEEIVPQEETTLDYNDSHVIEEEESEDSGSGAGVAALATVGVLAVVGAVHITKKYIAPVAAKGWNKVTGFFHKKTVVEGEATEEVDTEVVEDTVTE